MPISFKSKPTLQIINVARGGIINEDDLLNALNNNQIARAALDVFEHEPLPIHTLIEHDKIIVTPHLVHQLLRPGESCSISVRRNYRYTGKR